MPYLETMQAPTSGYSENPKINSYPTPSAANTTAAAPPHPSPPESQFRSGVVHASSTTGVTSLHHHTAPQPPPSSTTPSSSPPNGHYPSSPPSSNYVAAAVPNGGSGVNHLRHVTDTTGQSTDCICDVWASNLIEEMAKIQHIVERYRFISVDTEFPGVVVTPVVSQEDGSYIWNTIRCNVNLLKIIQLGLSFCDEYGNHPPGVSTWQFNFNFDVGHDMYAQDSLEMLEKAGLDFDRHREDGIDVNTFAELMISSGLVLNGDTHWIAFHSGYDFGYLLKVLTNAELPETENEFLEQITTWFGHVYDVKYLVKSCPNLNHRTGLNQLAAEMRIERIGPAHQAGSDSLITMAMFFRLCQGGQAQVKNVSQYKSILYGLGVDAATTFQRDNSYQQHPAHTRTGSGAGVVATPNGFSLHGTTPDQRIEAC